jgi:hypothetical protein
MNGYFYPAASAYDTSNAYEAACKGVIIVIYRSVIAPCHMLYIQKNATPRIAATAAMILNTVYKNPR